MKAAALVCCLATVLGAQSGPPSVRSRLEGRVPAEIVTVIDSIVRAAEADSLPTAPLVQKALEGGAKHVAADRIVAAVVQRRDQLDSARAVLVQSGDQPPVTSAEVTEVAAALARGLPRDAVGQVVAALPADPRASALHAVADLQAHKFDVDSATALVIASVAAGLHRERLLDVATAAIHELQRGKTRAEALATVRGELPNVPFYKTPPPAAGAKRPTRSAL